MILIISLDLDTATDEIERWLRYYQADFIRINASSLSTDLKYVDPFEDIFEFRNGMYIDPAGISVVYMRKWFPNDHLKLHAIDPLYNTVTQSIRQENEVLGQYFKSRLKHARWIDDERYTRISKMEQLLLAKSCGIKVPQSIITSRKEVLTAFIRSAKTPVITKPFAAHFSWNVEQTLYSSYTEIVDDAFIDRLPEEFSPSLFQEYVAKKFEVRCFFLDGVFYPLIYFTQAHSITSIDSKKGNGVYRYKTQVIDLPAYLVQQLDSFMRQANLTTGSFDLIYTPDNEFVFVELNPAGIFDNVSYLGNYGIEKAFAQTLIRYDKSN